MTFSWNFKFTKGRSATTLSFNNEINADLNSTNKHNKKLPWFSKFFFQKHFLGCRYTGQTFLWYLLPFYSWVLFVSLPWQTEVEVEEQYLENQSLKDLAIFFMLVHLRWYQFKHLSQTIDTSSSSIG